MMVVVEMVVVEEGLVVSLLLSTVADDDADADPDVDVDAADDSEGGTAPLRTSSCTAEKSRPSARERER